MYFINVILNAESDFLVLYQPWNIDTVNIFSAWQYADGRLVLLLLSFMLIGTQPSLLLSSRNVGHTDKTLFRSHPSIGKEQDGYLFVKGLNKTPVARSVSTICKRWVALFFFRRYQPSGHFTHLPICASLFRVLIFKFRTLKWENKWNLITVRSNPTENIFSWKVISFSVSQDFPRILLNREVH